MSPMIKPRDARIMAISIGEEANRKLLPESYAFRYACKSPSWRVIRDALTFEEAKSAVIDGWNIAEQRQREREYNV